MDRPFRPFATATLAVTATTTPATIREDAPMLEIQNDGGTVAFVRWGRGTQTATTADYPILPGQSKIVLCNTGCTNFAAICPAGGATTLYVTSGEGV